MPSNANRTLLGLAAVFFLAVDLAMLSGIWLGHVFAGIVIGAVAAQVTLLAVLATLAGYHPALRISVAMLGVAFICMFVFRMGGMAEVDRIAISAASILQWIAVQIPLWIFRTHFGWRLQYTVEQSARSSRQDMRFGIRQLMAWTAVAAVYLSIFKTIMAVVSFGSHQDEMIAITALLTIFNSLAAWPMIWAAFVQYRMLAWCVVAVVCSALLCVGEILAFQMAVGPGANIKVVIEALAALHGIQLIAVGGSLLLIRWNGVRLVRENGVAIAADFEAAQNTDSLED